MMRCLLSFLFVALAVSAAEIRFPADSGYVDIRTQYGAKGDGIADDTAAFQKAAFDNVRRLYIPAGTYLLSDTVVFGPKRWILQGAGKEFSTLRLAANAPGFGDAAKPKPFISTFAAFMDPKASMGQAFRSSVYDLTIEVGAGNPGAVALHYLNNNQGAVRDVRIRSIDPAKAGRAGLAMVTNWPGPALFKDVEIEGFDFGVWSQNSQYGLIFEDLILRHQREAGFENRGQTLGLHRFFSENRVPALRTSGSSAHVVLIGCDFRGGAPGTSAILNTEKSALLARGIRVQGYTYAIEDAAGKIPGSVEDWCSHPPLSALGGEPPSPLSIEDAPRLPLPPVERWASVAAFGGKPVAGKLEPDCGPALQAAIDSGAEVVYFPQGTWAIATPVIVRGKVRLITALDNRLRYLTGDRPTFTIADGEAAHVALERIDGDYSSRVQVMLLHASKRPVILRHSFFGNYRNNVPGGKVFIEDVCGSDWDFTGQQVWMRQFNTEAKGADPFNVRMKDTRLWTLGLKTEGPKCIVTAQGGALEVLAGFLYASRGTDKDTPAFDLTDTAFIGNWVNHLGGNYRPQVSVRRGTRTATLELHTDFSDRARLGFIHRVTVDGKITHEAGVDRSQKQQRIYQHGSYGVKVPLFISQP